MWKSDEYYLEKAIEVSRKSRAGGNTPFGCVLVDGDGEIILEQGNVEITEKRCTGHAETVIMERASKLYDKKFLWNCTLYTTCEPCPMCLSAIIWSNIKTVYYGCTKKDAGEIGFRDDIIYDYLSGKNNDLINLQEMDRNECIKTFEEYKKQNGVIY